MKRICFLEMEGVIAPFGNYLPDKLRVNSFLGEMKNFSKSANVEFFLISGHFKDLAIKRFSSFDFGLFFDEKHFLFVDESYISKKAEVDRLVYEENLSKDPDFVDSYFKQVKMQDIIKKMGLEPKDALLLSDDLWVDGYYSLRFSKVDFAIFSENVLDRGKPVDVMGGLAYFNLGFGSVRTLVENFPVTSNVGLEKYVFDSMKNVLIGEDFADKIKSGIKKKYCV